METDAPVSLADRLAAAHGLLAGAAAELSRVGSDDLPALASQAAAVACAAQAAQAAIVLEASQRGVIAASDHPGVKHWVEQSFRDAQAPVRSSTASALRDVAKVCEAYDLRALKAAVTEGALAPEVASRVARTFRRLRTRIDDGSWDEILANLIDFAAMEPAERQWKELEDLLIGQHGNATELEDEQDQMYRRRNVTECRHNPRTGMYEARMSLDAAAAAIYNAAINALSPPAPTRPPANTTTAPPASAAPTGSSPWPSTRPRPTQAPGAPVLPHASW